MYYIQNLDVLPSVCITSILFKGIASKIKMSYLQYIEEGNAYSRQYIQNQDVMPSIFKGITFTR